MVVEGFKLRWCWCRWIDFLRYCGLKGKLFIFPCWDFCCLLTQSYSRLLPVTWSFIRFKKVILYCKLTDSIVWVFLISTTDLWIILCFLFLLISSYRFLCWCEFLIITWFHLTLFWILQRHIPISYVPFMLWTLPNLILFFQKTDLWAFIKPRLVKKWGFLSLLSFCSVLNLMTTLSATTNFFQLLFIQRLKRLNILLK